MAATRTVQVTNTETEIAVLQVQVRNVESDISEIKQDLKEVSMSMKENSVTTNSFLKEMKEASATAHKAMADKITSLEKWRWMMMGAGIVLGSMGSHTFASLLK